MRIKILIDGMTTEQMRELAARLSTVGHRRELQVGCDGPALWGAETPYLTPGEHAQLMCKLVKFHGEPIADVLDRIQREDS